VADDLIRAASKVRFLGVPVEAHESLGSTNDEVFRRAGEGAPQGLVVLARHQTAGKGRLGRTWFDQPDRSLMFSVLLQPTIPLPSYPLLSLTLASSVAATASIVGSGITVKWPNDVLQRGKKFCGILAESRALRPGQPPVLVLGAGVNVSYGEEDFPQELRGTATSLTKHDGGRADPSWLFSHVLQHFAHELAMLEERDLIDLLRFLETRMPPNGSAVRIVLPDRVVEGEYRGLTVTGALTVRHAGTGALETLTAGVMQ
jgi:BirA family biotin operon repressor/biotin-[acetyl-CoA-carboxylase] ligase